MEQENVHIMPINDLKLHVAQLNCPCQPYRDPETANLIIHVAYDGREFAEEQERDLISGDQ